MPIFEYQCKQCGTTSEFLIGISQEKTKIKCRKCGSTDLEKIFSKTVIAKSSNILGSQHGKTCCGREERCDKPPCADRKCQR